jgi:hypothetical protein
MAKKFKVEGLVKDAKQIRYDAAIAFYRAFPHEHLSENDYLDAVTFLAIRAKKNETKWKLKHRNEHGEVV